MIWVTPCGVGPGREIPDITRAEPTLYACLIGHKAFARENDISFVLGVMPFVAYRTAFPDYDAHEPIISSNQYLAARLRLAA